MVSAAFMLARSTSPAIFKTCRTCTICHAVALKPVVWIKSSRKDLKRMPETVQREVGQALWIAQLGGKPEDAKPLKGFGGAGVLEIVESHDGNAYRAVYTVRFKEAVYVLHVFEKKSKRGIETPQTDVDLIKNRLREAEEIHRAWRS